MTVFEATEVLARGQSVQARGLADLRRLNNRYAVLVDLYGELCEAYVLSLRSGRPRGLPTRGGPGSNSTPRRHDRRRILQRNRLF